MGCDIHSVVQTPWNEGYRTRHHDVIGLRSYSLFSWLASVRINDERLDDSHLYEIPKGLPADFEVNDDMDHPLGFWGTIDDNEGMYWMGEHSHSYLSLSELKILYEKSGDETINDIVKFMEAVNELHYSEEGKEPRLVFGFDN
jgi:hypothetical protein